MVVSQAVSLLRTLRSDLTAETTELVGLLRTIPSERWRDPTPAEGWSVLDQVTHLAYFDDATVLSIHDPSAFAALRAELTAYGDGFPDVVAERHRTRSPTECLTWFIRSRSALLEAYGEADPAMRLPWFGPPMGVASSVTARLMETWAHGQDVVDALGVTRKPTARLRHVADLGVRTRGFSYALHGRPVPEGAVRVELASPGGEEWQWGPADAASRITGSALSFCLVVTQRRHPEDTDLRVEGAEAMEWMSLAQAFAGGAGTGRPPGMFATTGEAASRAASGGRPSGRSVW